MRSLRPSVALLLALAVLSGCYRLRGSAGGGETTFRPPRLIDPQDVAVPEGYRVEAVATDLTYPTDVAFDAEGRLYVLEAGWSYGTEPGIARLSRVDGPRTLVPIAERDNPPWNGVTFHEGAFYVAGGHVRGGELLRITPEGTTTPLVDGLPSYGDHHTNGPAVRDGYLYFAQGTATNAAVVGPDNYDYGWLDDHPDFHDVPCTDVTLSGRTYASPNPLTPEVDDTAETSPFAPFNTTHDAGHVVPGALPCSGAILRLPLGGGPLELVAWGFRNPFGLAFAPDGTLYATENSYDDRGSRPAWGTADLLWTVEAGAWYGWPDFAAGVPFNGDRFDPPGEDAPAPVLAAMPGTPPSPTARLGVHASSNGLDVAPDGPFGHAGDVFIAQFGDLAPQVGKVLHPVGFRVVRVEPERGTVHGFAENREARAPASRTGGGGLERPVAVRFSPDGTALYVVDFGVVTTERGESRPHPGTGVVWRITRSTGGR